jgi:hypothetical protein
MSHIDAMPTQPSKKRKHGSYSNSEKAWLVEIYDENSRLSAQELGERLAEHVNSKRSADLVPKNCLLASKPFLAHDCAIWSLTSFPPKTGLTERWSTQFPI